VRSSRDSSVELCGRNSVRITRWPSHITTPRLPASGSNTTTVDATEQLFDLWVTHYEEIPDQDRRLLPLRPVYFLSAEE
jgi:hypothetical protein